MELEEEVLHKAAVVPGSVPVTGTYSKTEREYQAAMGNIGGTRATEVGVFVLRMDIAGTHADTGMCMHACGFHGQGWRGYTCHRGRCAGRHRG